MKVVYFADDGTRFEDEDECELYERKQTLLGQITQSCFFSGEGNYMTAEEWLANPECCDYMKVANDEEAEWIYRYLRDDIGLCHPWEDRRANPPAAGYYYYNRKDDRWHNFETDYNEMLRILHIFGG